MDFKKCDRCGENYKPNEVNKRISIWEFNSLYWNSIDLCPNCLQIFEAFINNVENVTLIKQGKNKYNGHPVDGFICSECGFQTEDLSRCEYDEENNDVNYYEYIFKFCPNCGVKIDLEV